MGQSWTEFFFRGYPSTLVDLFRESPRNPDDLRRFTSEGFWRLGKPLRTNMPRGHHIMVLWFILQMEDGSSVRYVAKTFSNFSIHEAESIIRRSGLNPAKFSASEVQRQCDPFLIEARAFEHIQRFCPTPQRAYFPRYLGVITDITRNQFPSSCVLRPRAVVLEAIFPNISSRRILTETKDHINPLLNEFKERLNELSISQLELDWYVSLFTNRLRQIMALHNIGITHGDVRDDHFRLPEDFYDTVLYDFSASYTFSPSMPCRRRLRSLSVLTDTEERQLQEIMFDRAVKLDLRHHLANFLDLDLSTVESLLFQPPGVGGGDLELIILKTSSQPDGFTMPSLASVFPFLESISPKEDPTWHVTRAQSLPHYSCAWLLGTETSGVSGTMLLSFDGRSLVEFDTLPIHEGPYFVVLFPLSWDRHEVHESLINVCNEFRSTGHAGSILSKSKALGVR